ncbi:hypothetical protein NADE_001449 [Nannochloris sp. 'desiccata']|nr:hypothetical protein KSW81_001691 [Chlorella desiccata (nom. nud.)]KAH7616639.1 hypothetical protein NADE_001449 [Chlorella desiccata (nom. nud.)]
MTEEPTSQAKQVRAMYSIMTGIENNLGGGEGVEGLYGSITGMHMQRMLAIMREHCGLDASSHLVDIGAGLGRPLIHALVTEGIRGATGIELDFIKCMKADAFLRQTANTMLIRGLTQEAIDLPVITCKPVEKVHSLDPATHAYSFWEGVPVDARVAFGRLFAKSRTLRSVTVVQRNMQRENPEEVMEHGYCFGPVNLVETLSVSMSGSNRHFTAYVFNKTQPPAVVPRRRGARAALAATAAAEEVLVATPPLSSDNAKLCIETSNDDHGVDAVSKKLDLTVVASPVVAGGGGGMGSRNASKKGPGRLPRKKNVGPASAPMSTRPSPRKQQQRQQQRPLLAALTSTRGAVRVTRHSQQQQQKHQKMSPRSASPMGHEARGLLGGGLVDGAGFLEGSVYPRTRRAVLGILS